MTLFPIDQVRGRHLVDKQVFSLTDADIVPIEIAMTAGRPAYILLGENGPQMLDARTGQSWDGVGAVDIRTVAIATYRGNGELEGIQKLDKAPKDYAGALIRRKF